MDLNTLDSLLAGDSEEEEGDDDDYIMDMSLEERVGVVWEAHELLKGILTRAVRGNLAERKEEEASTSDQTISGLRRMVKTLAVVADELRELQERIAWKEERERALTEGMAEKTKELEELRIELLAMEDMFQSELTSRLEVETELEQLERTKKVEGQKRLEEVEVANHHHQEELQPSSPPGGSPPENQERSESAATSSPEEEEGRGDFDVVPPTATGASSPPPGDESPQEEPMENERSERATVATSSPEAQGGGGGDSDAAPASSSLPPVLADNVRKRSKINFKLTNEGVPEEEEGEEESGPSATASTPPPAEKEASATTSQPKTLTPQNISKRIISNCSSERTVDSSNKRKRSMEQENEEERDSSRDPEPIIHPTLPAPPQTRKAKANRKAEFICEICGKKLSQRRLLLHHVRRAHRPESRNFGCDKRFYQMANLTSHDRSHTGKLPFRKFKCDHCPSNQSRHKERNEKGPKCDRLFKTKGKVEKHLIWHSKDRPFPCDICDARFKIIGDLRSHRRSHTGEKALSLPLQLPSLRQKVN